MQEQWSWIAMKKKQKRNVVFFHTGTCESCEVLFGLIYWNYGDGSRHPQFLWMQIILVCTAL